MAKTILVLEDDEDIRNIIRFILEEEGYNVFGCNCELYGLDAYAPDLILLDEWINQQEAHMLCKEIKILENLAAVPVIIFSTALAIEEIAATCKADGFIRKPFDLDVLLAEIRKFLPLGSLANSPGA
ncbi:MAG TPA: response regulator [Mucilaginibacter sp.]|jgi:two-component system phosphate regulon response regulator PhoB